jgi:hypothetical protein
MNGVVEQFPMTPNPALNAILLGHLRGMDPHFWPGIDGLTLDVVLDSYCQAAAAWETAAGWSWRANSTNSKAARTWVGVAGRW